MHSECTVLLRVRYISLSRQSSLLGRPSPGIDSVFTMTPDIAVEFKRGIFLFLI